MTDESPRSAEQPPTRPAPATETGSIRLSKARLGLAVAIAALSDAAGGFLTLTPPIVWAIDLVTALLLFIVLGWHWLLLPGLLLEAIPGVGVLPFWLLVVGGIAVWGTPRPRLRR
jgi:hypothetical protein